MGRPSFLSQSEITLSKLLRSMSAGIQQAFSRSVNILQPFQGSFNGGMTIIYQPGLVSPYDRVPSLRYYGFVTDLRMMVDINSIEENTIPDLTVTSSRTERLAAVRDMEWKNPRKQIDFFVQNSYTPWIRIASISLLNRVPYYHINLLSYFSDTGVFNVGNDTVIGAKIINVGYGLLEDSDSVNIFGSAKEEITVLPDQAREISYATDYDWEVTTESRLVLPANPNRLQATFVNSSLEHNIYLSYASEAQMGKGIALIKGGGSYEINASNLYRGQVSATSTGTALLTALEAV